VLALDLAIGLGTAQRQTGAPAYRDTLLDAARRAAGAGDTERLVAAALANDRGFYSAVGAIDAAKVEILETTLDLLSPDDADRALVLATLCSELAHGSPLDRRQALAHEAVSIAQSHGDDAIIVRVLNHLNVPLQVPSLLGLSLVRTTEALVRAERLGDPVLLFWAAAWRAETAARAGDIDEMDRCLEIQGSMAQRLNQPIFNWGHTFGRSLRAQIAGDTDRAEALATEALHIGSDSGQPDASIIFGVQLMIVCGQRGTMSELIPLIEVGDPKYAGPLFDRLAPWGDQLPATGASALGPVKHYLGGLATVLGRYAEADACFAQAAAFSDRLGAKFFGARTSLLWGRMLGERRGPGDVDRARGLLAEAHAAAATHGYGNVERRAADALKLLDR
jgi:hypothetical protein